MKFVKTDKWLSPIRMNLSAFCIPDYEQDKINYYEINKNK